MSLLRVEVRISQKLKVVEELHRLVVSSYEIVILVFKNPHNIIDYWLFLFAAVYSIQLNTEIFIIRQQVLLWPGLIEYNHMIPIQICSFRLDRSLLMSIMSIHTILNKNVSFTIDCHMNNLVDLRAIVDFMCNDRIFELISSMWHETRLMNLPYDNDGIVLLTVAV